MKKVLGLDIGANSVGWVLLDEDENKIIDMGVRVFQAGVNDLDTAKEQSRNAARREARQIRKQLRRRKFRKELLITNLIAFRFIKSDDLENIYTLNPYELRAKAIYEKIELFELARIFLHLCKRRGYKSNRKDSLDEKEKGAIYDGTKDGTKPGISELRAEMEAGGFKTIGEYFYSLNPHEKRIRNRYTERKMYQDEFDLIWEKQKQFYPALLTDENFDLFRNIIIYYQRPLKSQKHLVGKCTLERNKRRAPKSSPLYQEFRMLQQVNSLRISGHERIDEEQKHLTQDERSKLIAYLETHKEAKFNTIMKDVFKLNPKVYRFNLENQDKLNGLSTYFHISKVFKKNTPHYTSDEFHKIWNTIYFALDDSWLVKYAKKTWNLDEEQARDLAKIRLEPDYGNLSIKAIKKIIPFMRDGEMYHDAALHAGYDFSLVNEEVKKTEYLPNPNIVANPIVNVAMFQVKKVVNELIDYYGMPDIIRTEMARDLKLPRQKRLDILKNNREQEKWHNEIKEILIKEHLVDEPKRTDIIKYKLWQECKGICPYTGRSISLHQLYNGEVDIEHIIPYSRSLDNSYMNLTISFREENARKGNKTPYEAYHGDPVVYKKIKERVKDFPHPKATRFTMDNKKLEEIDKIFGDFIHRQLNDTRYIAKLSLHYLKHICDDVQVTTGQTTSTLRRLWGLNSVLRNDSDYDELTNLEKSREDHRHHAVDALVVALTTRSYLQKLSTMNRIFGLRDDDKELIKKFPLPWENFRNDAKKYLNRIIVSHKTNLKARGKLHEETLYGKLKNELGDDLLNENNVPLFAVRKPLNDSLTHSQIHSIIDPVIKQIVLDRLISLGVDVSKKFKVPANAFTEPLYLIGKKKGTKTQIKKVRIRVPASNMINIHNYNVWVEPGSNHHIIIYVDENGKQQGKSVTLYEALQRKKNGLPVIDRELKPQEEFIMSLQRNELIIWGDSLPAAFDETDKATYHTIFDRTYRVQKMSGVNLTFRLHNFTRTDQEKHYSLLFKSTSGVQGKKIKISPAGFIEFV